MREWMQEKKQPGHLESIKEQLRKYKRSQLEFNEPLFDLKLERRKIDKDEVIRNLLKPSKLAFVGLSESKNQNYEYVYDLYFKLSKNRIFKVVASLKPEGLYVITVFKIRRNIQNEALKYYKK
jgi:hypothetical protein